MATITKTEGQVFLSHQAVTHPDTVVGSEVDVGTGLACSIVCFHALVEATANTNPGKFLIQTSPSASGSEDWSTYQELIVNNTTADTEAMTATEPIAETVLAVASTTGFVTEDVLYIQDVGTLADSEWGLCQEIVTNTSINLVDGLTVAKDSADVIWNDANVFPAVLIDCTALARVRVVFMHEGATGANCHVKALGIVATEIV